MWWNFFQNTTNEAVKITAIIGLGTWLYNKFHGKLIPGNLIYSKNNLTTKDIHSTFRKIYAMLWLDITYLMVPNDMEEDIRARSFHENGYFKKLEKDEIKIYKFRFFEKKNTDKSITASVNLEDNKITLELNLRKKDIRKIIEIFAEDNYEWIEGFKSYCHNFKKNKVQGGRHESL